MFCLYKEGKTMSALYTIVHHTRKMESRSWELPVAAALVGSVAGHTLEWIGGPVFRGMTPKAGAFLQAVATVALLALKELTLSKDFPKNSVNPSDALVKVALWLGSGGVSYFATRWVFPEVNQPSAVGHTALSVFFAQVLMDVLAQEARLR
jgi:hypothetical protein